MNLKTVLITSVVASLVITGSLVAAQDDSPTTEPAATAEFEDAQDGRERFGMRDGRRGPGMGAVRDLVLEYTGLTGEEIRTALSEGQTLADLIVANGQTVEAFVDAATAPLYERIDTAVAEERITAEEAETRKAEITARLTEGLESGEGLSLRGLGERGNRDRRVGGRAFGGLTGELVEEYTGLTGTEVREALRNGQTIADLITANGGSVDDFIAEAVVEAEAALDARVEERRANLESNITAIVNGERPSSMRPDADTENRTE